MSLLPKDSPLRKIAAKVAFFDKLWYDFNKYCLRGDSMRRILSVLLLAAVLIVLSGCSVHKSMFNSDYKENVTEYAMIAESDDLSVLDSFPNLTYVDLRGSTCYDAILAYSKANPHITVRYNVFLNEKRFNHDATEINLNGYEIDFDNLMDNLKYLPDVKTLYIDQIEFTVEQIHAIRDAYPQIDFTYSVEICDRRLDPTVDTLDLSFLHPENVEETAKALPYFESLTYVELMTATGTSALDFTDVLALQSSHPEVQFHYTFNLFGQHIATTDTELVYDSIKIGNDGVDKIRLALDIMPDCTYAKFDTCGIDNEVMAQLRDDYPEIKVVWRLTVDRYSILTDEEMVRMTYSLTQNGADLLKYCTDVKYLDVSGSKLKNIDFVSNMPNLEAAILTLVSIRDLSPLANCPNLTWLELVSCSNIRDLTSLSGLKNLKYLNISQTNVTDLTSLDEVPVERFSCVKSALQTPAITHFTEKHPNCVITRQGSALGYGWRYEDGNALFPYYAQLRQIFRYDDPNFYGNVKGK